MPTGNRDLGSILTLTAQAAGTVNGATQGPNMDGCGVAVVVDVTAITGTGPSVTVTIQGLDQASGKWRTLLASAAISTVSTTTLYVFPGSTVTANAAANAFLPVEWRVIAVVAGTTPAVTATIGANVFI